jgi:hypothetical protein
MRTMRSEKDVLVHLERVTMHECKARPAYEHAGLLPVTRDDYRGLMPLKMIAWTLRTVCSKNASSERRRPTMASTWSAKSA